MLFRIALPVRFSFRVSAFCVFAFRSLIAFRVSAFCVLPVSRSGVLHFDNSNMNGFILDSNLVTLAAFRMLRFEFQLTVLAFRVLRVLLFGVPHLCGLRFVRFVF